jgi:hypothetical protein
VRRREGEKRAGYRPLNGRDKRMVAPTFEF